jgi:hypothetical protein
MLEFPCIISLYYIKNLQDATLAVLFINHCKITLYISDTFCVHHQEYKNCSSSHWCMSWVGMMYILWGCPRSVATTKTVVAATGACHGLGWYVSSKDVQGWLPLHCTAVATDLGHPYWIHIIQTHDMHQWLLLKFLYSWWWTQKASETCRVILQWLINNTAKVASCWFFI